MTTIYNYITEKLRINNDTKIKIPLVDKLEEICQQCKKDEDFVWYNISESDKYIKVYFRVIDNRYNTIQEIKYITDIIKINLEDKYNIKKFDYDRNHRTYILIFL